MESRNLMIHESSFEDCTIFAAWEQCEQVKNYFDINKTQSYYDVAKKFILADEDKTQKLYTIISKATNTPIGRIVVSKIDLEKDSLEISRIYIADSENRERGLGTEAMEAILELAFINMHLERVSLSYFPDQDKAARFFRKLGFTEEGIARSAAKRDGKYYDLKMMSLLRSEYFDKREN